MPIPYFAHNTYQAFRDATIGQAIDVDGYPPSQPYQCYDSVAVLYQQSDVGQYLYTAQSVGAQGDGVKTCWLNVDARNRNGSGYFEIVNNVTDIKRGDIIVLNEYSGWYASTGHIGFADEDYNGTDYIQLLSQNFAGHHYVTVDRAYLGNAFLGVFRFIPWETTPPVPPTPTGSKKRHFPYPVAWKYWWNHS